MQITDRVALFWQGHRSKVFFPVIMEAHTLHDHTHLFTAVGVCPTLLLQLTRPHFHFKILLCYANPFLLHFILLRHLSRCRSMFRLPRVGILNDCFLSDSQVWFPVYILLLATTLKSHTPIPSPGRAANLCCYLECARYTKQKAEDPQAQ